MISVRAVVLKHHIKGDKSVKVKILISEGQKRRYMDSGIVVFTSDLTKKLKIKGPITDTVNSIVRGFRERINSVAGGNLSFDQVVSFLSTTEDIDFIKLAEKNIIKLLNQKRYGTARNRKTALNSLKRFCGDSLPINNITALFLSQFEAFIRMNPLVEGKTQSRAVSLYLGQIRTIHNEIKMELNQEDIGLVKIPYSPFSKYKIPKEDPSVKRALDVEKLREFFNIESVGRGRLAIDCCKLSFFLIGMNAVDLYNCSDIVDGKIIYNRTKTASRRSDKAKIVIVIQDEIMELVETYRDKSGKRVFDFYKRYASISNFNHAISKGLKQINAGLTFYSMRHSWASIALNDVRIDKYTVHSALNHVDEAMRTTDIYIKKDFSAINEANRKVIDFVIGSDR